MERLTTLTGQSPAAALRAVVHVPSIAIRTRSERQQRRDHRNDSEESRQATPNDRVGGVSHTAQERESVPNLEAVAGHARRKQERSPERHGLRGGASCRAAEECIADDIEGRLVLQLSDPGSEKGDRFARSAPMMNRAEL